MTNSEETVPGVFAGDLLMKLVPVAPETVDERLHRVLWEAYAMQMDQPKQRVQIIQEPDQYLIRGWHVVIIIIAVALLILAGGMVGMVPN